MRKVSEDLGAEALRPTLEGGQNRTFRFDHAEEYKRCCAGKKLEKKTPAARTLIPSCGREPAPEKI